MKIRAFFVWMILSLCLFSCVSFASEDIILADFEGKDFGSWTACGSAFGSGPAHGTLPHQKTVSGFEGKGYLNSYHGQDKSTGKITSPLFKIERDYIEFLIGGGQHPQHATIRLFLENGKEPLLSASGNSIKPTDTEKLFPFFWNVARYKGQKAKLVIEDVCDWGWGHILVDSIVQTDHLKHFANKDRIRKISVEKKYLLVPVAVIGQEQLLAVYQNGRLEHSFFYNAPKTKDEISWWSYFDVSEYIGKDLDLCFETGAKNGAPLDLIEQADEPRHLQPLYNEPLRPQLRFSQVRGWNNDPNGMTWFNGEYHFFWQSNPVSMWWGNLYWGHAVSQDLIHWKELPYALRPRLADIGDLHKRHPAMGTGRFISGCGNVSRDGKTMYLAVPNAGGISLAESTDGRNFHFPEYNPVLRRGCDPHLVWYELGKYWVMVTYGIKNGSKWMYFSKSSDLKKWTPTSELENFFECPQLVHLPVDGNKNKKHWAVFGADGKYFTGNFNGETFLRDHEEKMQTFFGPYYAAQVYSNDPKGRTILVGWLRVSLSDVPFNQLFTVPMELGFRTVGGKLRLTAKPVEEMDQMRGESVVKIPAKAITSKVPLSVVLRKQLYDIQFEIRPKSAKKITFMLGQTPLVYDVEKQTLGKNPLALIKGALKIRIISDRPCFELFANDGLYYEGGKRNDGGRGLGSFRIMVDQGSAEVSRLEIAEMKSIWNNPDVPYEPNAREITVQKKFLQFPVKSGAPQRWVRVEENGNVLREFIIELASDKNDVSFYAPLEVGQWTGKKIRLIDEKSDGKENGLDLVRQSDRLYDEPVHAEKYRPQFHFAPPRGWTNDPNGLVFYKGTYHLFYQHNPFGVKWNNMSWGHAVSPDLFHWTDCPDAMLPDPLGSIFSGSAVVDWNNTSGLKKGNQDPLLAFFTYNGPSMRYGLPASQGLAYSLDAGKSWTKYANNPIIPNIIGGNRDPKVFRYEPGNKWILALYMDKTDYALFESKNLIDWKKICDIKESGSAECPDMFELAVDGNTQNKKWVFWGGNGKYSIGSFDGTNYIRETEALPFYWGGDDYAAQSYSDTPGRRIQFSWMRGGVYPNMPFNQQFTVPRELTLRSTPKGIRLAGLPVKELDSLRDQSLDLRDLSFSGKKSIPIFDHELLNLSMVIDPGNAKSIELSIRDQKIILLPEKEEMIYAGINAPLPILKGKCELRIVLDRMSIELFAGQGLSQAAKCIVPVEGAHFPNLDVNASGKICIDSLKVHSLKSVWKDSVKK
ncbi:MAG: hypothetical protein Q4G69_03230 [Planctomycetia bacterium]|nr:hypothetical protein [Planctomycetia bacterium]